LLLTATFGGPKRLHGEDPGVGDCRNIALPNISSALQYISKAGKRFHNIILLNQYALQYSVTAAALGYYFIRKEFRYYLARAFIKNVPDMADSVKLHWLNKRLHEVNRRSLR
jgi:hypothetical protein